MALNRREFVRLASALGASLAWGGVARASRTGWREARELYPEGVASGDPDPTSVILWTRRPFPSGTRQILTVEVATDPAFRRVVARAAVPVSAAADWTGRVLSRARAWLERRAMTIAYVLLVLISISLLRNGIAGLTS